MRIGRVMGNVTLNRHEARMPAGALLLVEVLDAHALASGDQAAHRKSAMPEALVVFDALGAGVGQLIAISEGGEAMQPFRPKKVPCDAYNAAIIDDIHLHATPARAAASTNGVVNHANI